MFPTHLPQPQPTAQRNGRHAWSLGCALALAASLSWLLAAQDLPRDPAAPLNPWVIGIGLTGNR